MKVYKYRANLFNEKEKRRRDTESLLKNEFYAAKFKELNDPFECSFDLQMKDSDKTTFYNSINPLDVGIYSLGMLQQEELFPSHELMWAHYANNHKGFCVAYDVKDSLDLKSCLFPVQYTDQRLDISSEMVKQALKISESIDETEQSGNLYFATPKCNKVQCKSVTP